MVLENSLVLVSVKKFINIIRFLAHGILWCNVVPGIFLQAKSMFSDFVIQVGQLELEDLMYIIYKIVEIMTDVLVLAQG